MVAANSANRQSNDALTVGAGTAGRAPAVRLFSFRSRKCRSLKMDLTLTGLPDSCHFDSCVPRSRDNDADRAVN